MKRFYCSDNGFVECDAWRPFCWVSVECPQQDDVRFLLDDLNVPPDFLDSLADPDERSRVEHDGNWRLTILRIPVRNTAGQSAPYITVPIGIISNNEILVTVCYHKSELVTDFVDHTRRRGIHVDDVANFTLRILYSSAYWYLQYLKDLNHRVTEAERHMERSIRNRDLLEMQGLQSTLVYFNTSVQGNIALIGRIRSIYGDRLDNDLLEDVEIELQQTDSTVKIYNDILESKLSSFASIISNNVNDIMKRMTGLSFVLMLPTLVASFYGMNVDISYGNHPWVFWAIVGGSLCVSLLLLAVLRKFKWL